MHMVWKEGMFYNEEVGGYVYAMNVEPQIDAKVAVRCEDYLRMSRHEREGQEWEKAARLLAEKLSDHYSCTRCPVEISDECDKGCAEMLVAWALGKASERG